MIYGKSKDGYWEKAENGKLYQAIINTVIKKKLKILYYSKKNKPTIDEVVK